MDILLIVLGVMFTFDGIVYFFKRDDMGTFTAIFALSLLILVKSFYITMSPAFGGVYTLWGIRALCIICMVTSIPDILGFKLRAVVRDQDGNIVCDSDGNPLIGKRAREYMKGTNGKTYKVDLKTPDGEPAPKEITDKVNEYFKQFLDKHGEIKEFDDDGTPITEDYINGKLNEFIKKEFGMESMCSNGLNSNNSDGFADMMEKLTDMTNIDVIREMDTESFVDTLTELFDEELCKECCDYEKCSKMSRNDYEVEHKKCIVELLNEPLISAQTPSEVLEGNEDDFNER